MKTREFLVSNSSSSSYIIIFKEEAFYKALEKLSEKKKRLIQGIAGEDTIFGEKVMVVEEWTTMGGDSFLDEVPDQGLADPYEVWAEFQQSIPLKDRWARGVDL
jgi:hypothetical protein